MALLPDDALRGMKVMFATPCYISAVSMHYVTSIFDLVHHATRFGLPHILALHSESLITRGRNKMVMQFLKDETLTHLFWIDSDIAFRPQSVCRLLLADRDIAVGLYPLKTFNWPEGGVPAGTTKTDFENRYTNFAFNPIGHGSEPISRHLDADGFAEVAEASTGFMCIKREAILRMMARYPELNYTPDGPPGNPDAPYHWLLFDCMLDPESRRYLSEDYAFCRRWRDLGGRIFADTTFNLQHLGQHHFQGDLVACLTAQGKW